MLRRLLAVALAFGFVPAAAAAEFNPVASSTGPEEAVTRVIVKLRPAGTALDSSQQVASGESSAAVADRMQTLGLRTRVSLRLSHSVTQQIHVVELLIARHGSELEATLDALRADSAVAYADGDWRRHPHATTPKDPLFMATTNATGQWYLEAPQSTPSGMTLAAVNAVGAWDTAKGSSGVVIADLDTGVRFDHPDLLRASAGGRLLPGFDFVGPDGGAGGAGGPGSAFLTANDGDGWDPDPSDPGDWIDSSDLKQPVFSSGCTAGGSSWHGTRTAGILGALTNNATGIAGLTWNSWILPVRVLGKCGGYDSDIIAGMLWAAGIAVAGVPANPYPAKILNMSLGSVGTCPAFAGGYKDAIGQVNARGAIVVVSAGNEGGQVDEPANCPGAIGVVGVRHIGTKVGYSSLGPEAALAAPAGNCVNGVGGPCLFSMDTTVNFGVTTPAGNGYTDEFNTNLGTSFAAPIVSGIAALMYSVNGNLSPLQLRARLQAAARTFPPANPALPMCFAPPPGNTSQQIECNCTTATCGAGLADASNAVAEALRPIAAVTLPASTGAGQTATLDAAGSAAACGHVIATYSWSISADTSGGTLVLSSLSGSSTSLPAPASGAVTVQLMVTDEQGRTDTATVIVAPTATTSAAPAVAGSTACLAAIPPPSGNSSGSSSSGGSAAGGGGGGAVGPLALAAGAAFAGVVLAARRRRTDGGVDRTASR